MRFVSTLAAWFDAESLPPTEGPALDRVDWLRCLPFLLLHAGCLLVVVVGVSVPALVVAGALYVARMFAVTAFYHRYFAHRAFTTSRAAQFVFAVAGATAAQRGPLWWAAHHRRHHVFSDTEGDAHTPRRGFWRSHMLWFFTRRNYQTDHARIRDFAAYPELRVIDRFDSLVAMSLGVATYVLGEVMHAHGYATNGWQMVVVGFCWSTVLLFHATSAINSLAHCFGVRAFPTRDDSRNNLWLALLTLGEGWHNNHHRYPVSARQGFLWWEVDLCYQGLRVLAWLRVIKNLRPVPAAVLAERAALGSKA
jgi:stearoyl-CoA desaturase (delta-9 desaturase)